MNTWMVAKLQAIEMAQFTQQYLIILQKDKTQWQNSFQPNHIKIFAVYAFVRGVGVGAQCAFLYR